MRKPTLFLAIALLLLTAAVESCSKKGGRKKIPHEYDVYAAGYEETTKQVPVATLWKNGAPVVLSKGQLASKANSVFVSGHDVYVAGFEELGLNMIAATLWKNGTVQYLTKGSKFDNAYSVSVSGQDVFVGGKEQGAAVIWKNGEIIRLSKEWSEACSIHVSGEDIYVAGWEEISPGIQAAMLWKSNPPPTPVADHPPTHAADQEGKQEEKIALSFTKQQLSEGSKNDYAFSVFVSGSTVYAAGHENKKNTQTAALWKNGQALQVGEGKPPSTAFSVFASGKNTYVVGVETGSARIAINNSRQFLSRASSWAYSVYVVGKDVHVAGSEQGAAVIWINGDTFRLTDGRTRAEAKSVFVL
jgi:hypothetical protein